MRAVPLGLLKAAFFSMPGAGNWNPNADVDGNNAVNFSEFVFVPTRESPEHDHPDFRSTMRWYYPFLPSDLHRLNAWKRQPRVDLVHHAGHRVSFPGLRPCPTPFKMRHYHFLSVPHAVRRHVGRPYRRADLERGWHGWRARLRPEMVFLPGQAELREYRDDDELDATEPWTEHHLGRCLEVFGAAGADR